MRLIITRHGETEENVKGILQGQLLPGKLTERGKEQARKVAARFKDEKIDAIYTSDLARAIDTAREIAKYHPDTPFYIVEELRERDFGSQNGRLKSEIGKEYAEDVESYQVLQVRTKKIIDEAYNKFPDGTVVFVAHGATNRSLISNIIRKPEDEIARLDNTGVTICNLKEDQDHEIELFNCTAHF
ncbi:histidine phosphatase family protein [Candidatus Woesearchaeota archaeon CG10_big_fil_rev_8_21_14_0_10_45_16]|nr:MAG: histidine phosphatase family protein [Candidatus Woesearchaeota archaeon CG10_big_fil_rev_8_21_14_0_10_45_16]